MPEDICWKGILGSFLHLGTKCLTMRPHVRRSNRRHGTSPASAKLVFRRSLPPAAWYVRQTTRLLFTTSVAAHWELRPLATPHLRQCTCLHLFQLIPRTFLNVLELGHKNHGSYESEKNTSAFIWGAPKASETPNPTGWWTSPSNHLLANAGMGHNLCICTIYIYNIYIYNIYIYNIYIYYIYIIYILYIYIYYI